MKIKLTIIFAALLLLAACKTADTDNNTGDQETAWQPYAGGGNHKGTYKIDRHTQDHEGHKRYKTTTTTQLDQDCKDEICKHLAKYTKIPTVFNEEATEFMFALPDDIDQKTVTRPLQGLIMICQTTEQGAVPEPLQKLIDNLMKEKAEQ